jgi:transposase
MKDGSTHLAHKAEYSVDLDTGAIVAVTLQGADQGDTTTLWKTVEESVENLRTVADAPQAPQCLQGDLMRQVVADKGYHSNDTLRDMTEGEVRTYVSEPDRGRRSWTDKDTGEHKSAEQAAVYANRRRIRGEHGKSLLRKRGELVERTFAHCYETGAMRRAHLRGHPNILKRLLIHVAGFNLALVMRSLFGIGKPRRLQDGRPAAILDVFDSILSLLKAIRPLMIPWKRFMQILTTREPETGLPVAA